MMLKGRRYPFYVSITLLLVATVLVFACLFLWVSQRESKVVALHTADNIFSEINDKVMERYENVLESVGIIAWVGTRMPAEPKASAFAETAHPGLDYMFNVLDYHSFLSSTYVGYADGSFVQLIADRNTSKLMDIYDAPPQAKFLLRTISAAPDGAQMQQRWVFLDAQRKIVGQAEGLDPDYDPRTRTWYQQALAREAILFTEPYVFSSSNVPGITCAKRLADGSGVFGVDITLAQFSLSLAQQKVSVNGILFLFERSGKIIVNPQENPLTKDAEGNLVFLQGKMSQSPLVRLVVDDYLRNKESSLNHTREIELDGTTYLVRLTGVGESLHFGQYLASVAPVSDFTSHIRRMEQRILAICGVILVVGLPIALLVSHLVTASLHRLELEALRIRKRDFSESPAFDSHIKEIHTLVGAFGLMKTTIRQLLDQQRKLFDDFTKLLAGAIDAKSPYTGGHCARVPRVAEMLAEAACRCQDGPLAGFKMATEDERWEFEVAAWLHDCGKITTPEYIVDKATKLETIYNRIHEIRMRFEVLLRDAEISYYRKRLSKDVDEVLLKTELEEEKRRIIEDFTFVASCNVGGEYMADENIERLKRIGDRTWTRYLDDRLGISEEETKLKGRQPATELPVVEQVLADKPEHVIPRDNLGLFAGREYNFRMTVPEHQYNLGELYNLSIPKGTLSEEDRFKINEHIIQTIIMLNKLEFPEYLANVPEFAGAHHETMIGTGYPRRLTKNEMSIPARIIAIADIFEALTAADRPYKKPKKLSESLRIMNIMCKQQHIDADLFNLFLESEVYRNYAESYLDPVLVDEINITDYLVR